MRHLSRVAVIVMALAVSLTLAWGETAPKKHAKNTVPRPTPPSGTVVPRAASAKKPAPSVIGTPARTALAPIATPVPTPAPEFPAVAPSKPATPVDLSPSKPALETLLKPKSITRVLEDKDIITNSDWTERDDFTFVNAVLIHAPILFARPKIMDFSLYKQMTPALQKFEYDPRTEILEVKGRAGGLKMHSWLKVEQKYWDEVGYEIVRGDMVGFKVRAYLFEREARTLAVARGVLPEGRKRFSTMVALVFKPLSEIVIHVATRNFRGYIEGEYKKGKNQSTR